jgi:type II secretory ATPase GspE/PulE/Tfp pilus assembly ATPase PilB-like protein
MMDMGAEQYLVAGVIVGILAQRLIRLNCQKCMKPYTPSEDEMEMLKFSSDDLAKARFMKGTGCPECRNTGLKGRVGLFELITGTQEFKNAIAIGSSYDELMLVARKQGYRSMLEDGRTKVLNGWTTPDEVLRAVYTQAMD